ncbi:MAG: HypC/HybG/HupF family hydrogenase formation chaperone [Candidatus Riflebacteria bacterium]|nr:HypC/HybG/HupF family hydrogenase formation chaperone [Candidatus Riflebacteria bacterium]
MCLAVPGKILSIDDNALYSKDARVDFGGTFKKVNLSFVPEAVCGDYVLVHAGMAISIIDENEALETIKLLKETIENEIY